MVSTSFLIYFGRPIIWCAIKTNCTTFQTVNPEICSILIFIKGSARSFPITFSLWFFKKSNSHVINWPNFILCLPLYLEMLGSMYIVIICLPVCNVITVIILKLTFAFLSSFVFLVLEAYWILCKMLIRRTLNMKWKAFFIILLLKQIKPTSLEGEKLT